MVTFSYLWNSVLGVRTFFTSTSNLVKIETISLIVTGYVEDVEIKNGFYQQNCSVINQLNHITTFELTTEFGDNIQRCATFVL